MHRAALAMDHCCMQKVCWFVVAIAKGRDSQSKNRPESTLPRASVYRRCPQGDLSSNEA